MSSKDYDELVKIFGGKWMVDRDENMEEFMTAAEWPELAKQVVRLEKSATISTDGNCIVEKVVIGDAETEMRTLLNVEQEYKDKEEDPLFHFKSFTTLEDGVWAQERTPQNVDGGKRYILKGHVEGDVLIVEMILLDEPSVTAKRFFKRSIDI